MMCGGGDKPIYISLSSQVPHDTRTSPSPFRATPGDPGRCLTKPGHAHQCAHGARRLVSPLSIRALPPGNWPICRYSAVPRRPRDLLILPSPTSQLALHRPQRPRAPPSPGPPRRLTTRTRRPAGAGQPSAGLRPSRPRQGGAQRTARPRRIQPRPPQSPALVTLRRRARVPRGPPRPTPPPGRVRPSADPGPSGPISPHYILSDTTGDMTDQKSVQPDRNL